jgi:methylated-DNA-[protein]-cysteine S-methyltransferase
MSEKNESLLWSKSMSDTPAGVLTIFVSAQGLAEIVFGALPEHLPQEPKAMALLEQVEQQLDEYFDGKRQTFDLPIDWNGMAEYQESVLRACFAIPYGEVRTYGGLARQTGRPKAARAVGNIMATNPIPIVIPCHRVIGSDGSLHGYGGGLDVKARLLKLEGSQLAD